MPKLLWDERRTPRLGAASINLLKRLSTDEEAAIVFYASVPGYYLVEQSTARERVLTRTVDALAKQTLIARIRDCDIPVYKLTNRGLQILAAATATSGTPPP